MSDSSIVLLLLLSSNLRVTLQSSGVVSSINKLRCFSGVGFVIRAMHLQHLSIYQIPKVCHMVHVNLFHLWVYKLIWHARSIWMRPSAAEHWCMHDVFLGFYNTCWGRQPQSHMTLGAGRYLVWQLKMIKFISHFASVTQIQCKPSTLPPFLRAPTVRFRYFSLFG